MADPAAVSVVIPAFNEAGAIARGRRRAAARPAPGARSSSSTTARPTARPTRAAAPARAWSGIRTTRATAPPSRAAIRAATGEYILIIDGDGQHKPADALRLVVAARRVRSRRRRALERDAGRLDAAALGNAALNRLASFLTERAIPDLTSGFRAARREHLLEFLHLLPNGFSTPTTTTMCVSQGGLQRRVRADRRAAARRRRRRSACRATARSSC